MSSTADFVADFDILTRTVALVNAVSNQIVFSNPQRFGLLFANNSGLAAWLFPTPMTATSSGILCAVNQVALYYNFRQHGALATFDWYAFPAGPGSIIQVIEVLYKPRRK